MPGSRDEKKLGDGVWRAISRLEREDGLWREAHEHAERVENALKVRTWNAGDDLLIDSLVEEARKMLEVLEKLQICAKEKAAG